MYFLTKSKITKTTKQKSKHKFLPEPGIEHRTSRATVWSFTFWQPSQLNVSIAVKPFKCFKF